VVDIGQEVGGGVAELEPVLTDITDDVQSTTGRPVHVVERRDDFPAPVFRVVVVLDVAQTTDVVQLVVHLADERLTHQLVINRVELLQRLALVVAPGHLNDRLVGHLRGGRRDADVLRHSRVPVLHQPLLTLFGQSRVAGIRGDLRQAPRNQTSQHAAVEVLRVLQVVVEQAHQSVEHLRRNLHDRVGHSYRSLELPGFSLPMT
jgi:hypothetical protein